MKEMKVEYTIALCEKFVQDYCPGDEWVFLPCAAHSRC